jgi:hypothetical protein
MKNTLLLLATLLLLGIQSFAQNVAINNDGSEPDPSAALDVKASDKGVLIPRVDFSNLPLSPATGLLVYVTANGPDGNDAFYYYNGTQWQKLSGAAGLENFTESNYTYDTKTGAKFLATNAANNVDFVISPKGAGAILAQQPDGTVAGGNRRGDYAVDFQMVRAGETQVASGTGAIILGGANNISSGYGSVVLGGGVNIASGDASAVLGYISTATGHFSFAAGYSNDATANYSIAIGRDATASNENAVAIGNTPIASGYASLAMGDWTIASGRISTAMGNRTNAPSAYETVFGRYNSDYTPSSTTDWIATDRLFVVGNGATDVAKSNALTILKNANTTIGGSLTLNGNGTNTSITLPTSRGANGQVLTSDGSGNTSWATPAASQWTTSGSNIYFNTGNIGIGTTSPGSKLTIGNNVGDGFNEWTDYQLLLFSAATPLSSFGIGVKASTLAFNSDSDFDFDQDGSTVMTIQSGKVGIGNPAPTQKLEVNGSTLIPSGHSYWIGSAADAGNRLRLHQTGSNAYIDWGEETLFFRSGIAAATTKVVFTADGKVGIGTTAPKAALDLGLGISNRKLILYTTADNNHQFSGLGINIDALRYQIGNTSGNHKFYAATSETTSTELFRIQGNGQIVIPALNTAGVLINSTSGVISSTIGTSGQVLTTDGTGGVTWATMVVADGSETKLSAGTNITVTGSGTIASPYVVNATGGGTTLSIGDSYQGGIIFWLDATGQHGLIAATADQSTGIQWYNGTFRYTGTTGDGLYAGAMNTTMIVATQMADYQTGNFAAKVCADYSVTQGGVTYGDWYLPSKYELNLLYAQKTAVGGFASAYYWSSSEFYNTTVWIQFFGNGSQYSSGGKEFAYHVRAIRAF